jgi:hypothetical protein
MASKGLRGRPIEAREENCFEGQLNKRVNTRFAVSLLFHTISTALQSLRDFEQFSNYF